MLTLEGFEQLVKDDLLETVIVGFTDHYGRLMGKRVDAEYFLDSVVKSGTHGCNYLLTTDMGMDPVPGYDYANWELGYGDAHKYISNIAIFPTEDYTGQWTDAEYLRIYPRIESLREYSADTRQYEDVYYVINPDTTKVNLKTWLTR